MRSAARPGRRAEIVALLALVVAQWAYVITGDVGLPRLVTALAFVLLVPGRAVVGLLAPDDGTSNLALSIGVGTALATLVVQVLVWSDRYSMVVALGILTAVSVPGLVVQYLRAGRAGRPAELVGSR